MKYKYQVLWIPEDETVENVEEELNDMSDEGWELISIRWVDKYERHLSYFRRPVSDNETHIIVVNQDKINDCVQRILRDRGEDCVRPEGSLPVHVSDLDLTVRAENCLRADGLTNIFKICTKTQRDISCTPNFGCESMSRLLKSLKDKGLRLGMDVGSILEIVKEWK